MSYYNDMNIRGGAPDWRKAHQSKGGMASIIITFLLVAVIGGVLGWWFLIRPGPDTIEVHYKGLSGTEKMDISVNNKVIFTDDAITKTEKVKIITVPKADLPVKTITVNFKNDSGSNDIYFSKFDLGKKSILSKFIKPPGVTLDAEGITEVNNGSFKWGGVYAYES